MNPAGPVHVVELFPGLSAELTGLLRSLPSADWNRATACPGWSVKDVAAHLLGGNLGRLWSGDERLARPKSGFAPSTYAELVDAIDRQNAEWVNAARRISPSLLIAFLEMTDRQLYQHFKALPPFELAGVSVAWAGEAQSPNWFDVAREYTEKWLHQQHIREAAGRPVLAGRRWLRPVLDTFMRALPNTYRGADAAEGTAIVFHISGEAGGDWSLLRRGGGWSLVAGRAPAAVSSVSLDQDVAWRLFTRGMSQAAVRDRVVVEGDPSFGLLILQMVSIMA